MCGLKSKLGNVIFEEFAKDFDILCLSETKLSKIDLSLSCLNDYHSFIKEKSIRTHQHGGVHGLCMIVKNDVANCATLITETQSPFVLWVHFKEEAFGLGCIIGSAYLPGENSVHKDNEMYDIILNDIATLKRIHKLPICLIGDLNSRTGNLDDTFGIDQNVISNCGLDEIAHDIFDLNSDNLNDAIYKTRVNSDTTVNNYGKLLIDFCQATNMKIVNGRIGSDGDKGDLTFDGPTGKSTIDYCIASHDLFPYIQDFSVDIPDQSLSDAHSPIILTLRSNPNNEYTNEITLESDINYEKINSTWCDNKKRDFQSNFDQDKIYELCQFLTSLETIGTNQIELDNTVKKKSSISTASGINTGISKQAKKSGNSPKKKESK